MSAKVLTLVGVAVAAAALPVASFAGGARVGVSIAIGGPPVAYYPPPPVVYYPPPVAYYPPPVAYYPRRLLRAAADHRVPGRRGTTAGPATGSRLPRVRIAARAATAAGSTLALGAAR